MPEENIKIQYEIAFANGPKKKISAELSPATLALQRPPQNYFPDWTKLTCSQCPNCPLDPQKTPDCPVASNLVEITEMFARNISYEEVSVTITTGARTYQRKLSLQDALRSLLGIYMPTSGCPIMDKLRPMVFVHLPFATRQETAYRVLSMYALAQLFIHRRGGNSDWEFKGLEKIYQDVEIVNRAFHKRLVSAGLADATLNAIGNLNCYAQFTQMVLEPTKLSQIENLFAAYFTG